MQVKIGKFVNWILPSTLFTWLTPVVGEYTMGKILDSHAFVIFSSYTMPIFSWINSKQERRIRIRVDAHDTINADETMALIIVPMLQQLRTGMQTVPPVDDIDLPTNLANPDNNTLDMAALESRWLYVLDEMIWAFNQIIEDDWDEQFSGETITDITKDSEGNIDFNFSSQPFDIQGYTEHSDRVNRGTILFGKYYRALWT